MNGSLVPRIDCDTRAVVERAVESLGALRGLPCVDDPGVQLHLIASLSVEIQVSLTVGVREARRHDYTWGEIAQLLGAALEATRCRYGDAEPADTRPSIRQIRPGPSGPGRSPSYPAGT